MVPGGNGTIRAAVPGGKRAAGESNTWREQQHRTWHLEDVAPWGTSTCRQQRCGGMMLPGNGAAGGTAPVESSAVGEWYLW